MTYIPTDTRKCTRTASTDQSPLITFQENPLRTIRDALDYTQNTLRLGAPAANSGENRGYEFKTTAPKNVRKGLTEALCQKYPTDLQKNGRQDFRFGGTRVNISYKLVNPYLVPGIGISPKVEDITLKIEDNVPERADGLADFVLQYLHDLRVSFDWKKLK